jgi:branched-chain amino acid transport system substrate-binding protein
VRQIGRVKSVLAIAMTSILGLSACGTSSSSGNGGGDKTFNVVVVAPMTGTLASYGDFTKKAYQASVSVVNARGGILGRKVKMTVLDDKGDPTTGVSALSAYLSTHPKPDLVYPGAASPEVQGTAPFLAKRGILTVSAAALPQMDDPAKYPLYFSTNTHNTASITKILDYIKQHGYQKIGLISSNDTIGDQISQGLDAAVKGTNLKVDKVLFPPTALDVTPELEKLKAWQPDVVVMDAVGELTLRIVTARQNIGWNVPLIGGVNSGGADFSKVSASALNGVYATVYSVQQWVPPEQRTASFNKFYSAIQAQGQLVFSNFYYAVDYDPLQLVAVAAEQAKSIDPKKIAAALEDLKQPANPPWVLFKTEGFSKTTHLNTSVADDYAVVQATPLDAGFTGKPAS